jgi:hypothetical protein
MAWHGMYARAGDNSYCIKRKIFEPEVSYITDFIQGAYKEHCPDHVMHINVTAGYWDAGLSDYWDDGANKGFCNSIFYSGENFTVHADGFITAPLPNTNSSTGSPYTIIESGANVTFIAGEDIILKKGFEVQAGATYYGIVTKDKGVLDTVTNLFPPVNSNTSKKYMDYNETLYKNLEGNYEDPENYSGYQQSGFNTITIYPNPNPGIFNVEINDSNNNNFTIEVSDMMGTRVYFSEHLQAGIIQIDITGSAKGIYFVKIQAGDQTFTKKVLYR